MTNLKRNQSNDNKDQYVPDGPVFKSPLANAWDRFKPCSRKTAHASVPQLLSQCFRAQEL